MSPTHNKQWLFVLSVLVLALVLVVIPANAQVYASGPHQDTTVHRFSDESVVDGASASLKRNGSGVTMNLKTSELEGGSAYTVWFVVFNMPQYCSNGACGEDDVADENGPNPNEAAGVSVRHAAGHVVGDNGIGNFSGRLNVGDDSGLLFGFPFTNPQGAEVHLVLRNHRQANPGHIPEQIHTFEANCSDCVDEQFAVFLAP